MTRASVLRAWTGLEDIDAPQPALQPPQPSARAAVAPSLPSGPSHADVEAARQDGFRQGCESTGAQAAARSAAALEAIAAALREEGGSAQAFAERAVEALAGVVLQAVSDAFPSLEERHGPADAAAFARRILPGLAREAEVAMRVGAGVAETVSAELSRLPEDVRGRIQVVADAALARNDVRLSWRDGRAARDAAATHAEILAALGLVPTTPAAPEHKGDQI